MKSIICRVIAILVVVSTLGNFPINAQGNDPGESQLSKITDELREWLDKIDDDELVPVFIYLTFKVDDEAVENEIYETLGYSGASVDPWITGAYGAYRKLRISIRTREYSASNNSFAANHLEGARILFQPILLSTIIAEVTKADVYRLSALDEVRNLMLCELFDGQMLSQTVSPRPLRPAPNLTTASEWAHEGITEAFNKHFVPSDIRNNYQNVITRAQFCRMAMRWMEDVEIELDKRGLSRDLDAFTDTSDPDILAAFALGITNGVGENRFDPDGHITREQAATMIMNVCSVIGEDIRNPPSSGFADMDDASSWAIDGINFVRANGIMQGPGGNNFNPRGMFTIQESIVTFNNTKRNASRDLNNLFHRMINNGAWDIMDAMSDDDLVSVNLNVSLRPDHDALIQKEIYETLGYNRESLGNRSPDAYNILRSRLTREAHRAQNLDFIENIVKPREERVIYFVSSLSSLIIMDVTRNELLEYAMSRRLNAISYSVPPPPHLD